MVTHLYQWGITYDPQTHKRVKCHVPTKASMSQGMEGRIQQVSCGTNFTLVLNSNNRVFILGDEPKYGRLGQGDDQTIVPTLTPVKGPLPPISFIASGPSTSVMLSSDGKEVWGFGKGIGYTAKQILQSEEPITHCACAENSVVVVINGHQIVERRFNRDGFTTEWTCVYQLVSADDRIQHIDIGSSLNGFVTEQGHVFLWGTTVPYGGISVEETFKDVSMSNPVQKDLISVDNDRPVQISCSRGQFHAHALLLTEQGCIYAVGSNYKAKLGVDISQSFTGEWMLIDITRSCPFKMIASGGIHSSALSRDGRVFTWGCGSDGRLGHAESQGHRYLYKESEPRPIDYFKSQEVRSIATAYYHMAAIVIQ